MNNIFRDYFFYNFLYSAELTLDLKALETECIDLKNKEESVEKSNRNGWQSEPKDSFTGTELNKLQTQSIEFARVVSEAENLKHEINNWDAWVNVNAKNSYNAPHTHPGSVLVGCFYVKVPEKSGDLAFIRTDAASGSETLVNKPSETSFILTPEIGRLYIFPPWLMHMVHLNESEQDRISIAINFSS